MPAGRPSKYDPDFHPRLAQAMCKLGAVDQDLADEFEVAVSTINKWKLDYPEFSEALKEAKPIANEKVKQALYHKAIGYSHPDTKIFCNEGDVTKVDTTKHYPPDTGACFIWLKNRDPENWRDKQEIDLGDAQPVQVFIGVKDASEPAPKPEGEEEDSD